MHNFLIKLHIKLVKLNLLSNVKDLVDNNIIYSGEDTDFNKLPAIKFRSEDTGKMFLVWSDHYGYNGDNTKYTGDADINFEEYLDNNLKEDLFMTIRTEFNGKTSKYADQIEELMRLYKNDKRLFYTFGSICARFTSKLVIIDFLKELFNI